MNTEKIKQILRKYLSLIILEKKHSYAKIYYHWKIVLILFLVFNLLSLGFSLYLFLQINEGGIFLVEQKQEIQIDTIDRGLLQELLESFEIKEVVFDSRVSSPPSIKDPSL